jgi:hypothetical protein
LKAIAIRRWVRRGFLVWAVVSTTWLANTMRTRGVPDAALQASPQAVTRSALLDALVSKQAR